MELRCQRHLHGKLAGRLLEVRCQQCSRDTGQDVFHWWDTKTGEMVAGTSSATMEQPLPTVSLPAEGPHAA